MRQKSCSSPSTCLSCGVYHLPETADSGMSWQRMECWSSVEWQERKGKKKYRKAQKNESQWLQHVTDNVNKTNCTVCQQCHVLEGNQEEQEASGDTENNPRLPEVSSGRRAGIILNPSEPEQENLLHFYTPSVSQGNLCKWIFWHLWC